MRSGNPALFQVTHTLGASRGYLCDSTAFLFILISSSQRFYTSMGSALKIIYITRCAKQIYVLLTHLLTEYRRSEMIRSDLRILTTTL